MSDNETKHTPTSSTKLGSLAGLQKRVDGASNFGVCPLVEIKMVAEQPLTLSVARRDKNERLNLGCALSFIAGELFPTIKRPQFLYRGVSLKHLEHVSKEGIDVEPTNAPIFATDRPDKALEYGELVMVFDPIKLDKTYRTAPKDAPDEVLSRLRAEYPTELEIDGKLWFSRMPADNARTGTIYESHYTFFIPDDPHEALLMLFVIG
ncbi:hypothetical protein QEH52_05540 [Coraliomargarita sp. SDUM461003]|uniref:Uncharacterized protein n=1 Tax=Thalassobacterium maritimum TaxID=3041265 RepID=A0ABU1AVF1_9BACT|nr:hypothetical protein [Coraliomargarita sp. SDUM461003]MDQ8206962.1 hypothetical protein [Coraliomargarita sp. SDUM461003]